MKKVLVLTAVLCLAASMSQACILECWLTVDNAHPTAGQTFTVSIWAQVLPGPGETLTGLEANGSGIQSLAVSIYQINPAGNYSITQATGFPPPPQTQGQCTVNAAVWDGIVLSGKPGIPPERYDDNDGVYTLDSNDKLVYVSGNGDFDALQLSEATSGTGADGAATGLGAPILVATELWTCLTAAQASLHITMPYNTDGITPAARYWDYSDAPTDPSPYEANFGSYSIGALNSQGAFVAGADLIMNGPVPEPATLALLGFGAVATLLRRRNKK